MPCQALRQDRVVTGLPSQRPAQRIGQCAGAFGEQGGRQAVGLGEHHVEGHDDGTDRHQPLDHVGDLGAWPWPLTPRRETGFIDIDDGDRIGLGRARFGPLIEIEQRQATAFERRHVLKPDRQQGDQKHEGQKRAGRQGALENLAGPGTGGGAGPVRDEG